VAPCPAGAECLLNDEHSGFRRVSPDYHIAPFLSEERIAAASLAEPLPRTARETRRVAEAVARLLGGTTPPPPSPRSHTHG